MVTDLSLDRASSVCHWWSYIFQDGSVPQPEYWTLLLTQEVISQCSTQQHVGLHHRTFLWPSHMPYPPLPTPC